MLWVSGLRVYGVQGLTFGSQGLGFRASPFRIRALSFDPSPLKRSVCKPGTRLSTHRQKSRNESNSAS